MSTATDEASIFNLLGNDKRWAILKALSVKPLTVSEIIALVDETQSATSHHLSLLRLSGWVRPERDGKNVRYTICRQKAKDASAVLRSLTA